MELIVFYLLGIAIIFFIAIKNHKKKRVTPFDRFLERQRKESEEKAKLIPSVTVNTSLNWQTKMYLDMIKSGKYDADALRDELKDLLKISNSELDEILKKIK